MKYKASKSNLNIMLCRKLKLCNRIHMMFPDSTESQVTLATQVPDIGALLYMPESVQECYQQLPNLVYK